MSSIELFGEALRVAAAATEKAGVRATPEGTRLQTLICTGIPVYNFFASLYGLPVLPLPAFCTPTP